MNHVDFSDNNAGTNGGGIAVLLKFTNCTFSKHIELIREQCCYGGGMQSL